VSLDKLFTKKTDKFECYEIDLFKATDDELVQISNQMGIALDLSEMTQIKDYFKAKGRKPTDIELQALGQAWSEHCCYKSSKVPLQEHVFGIAEEKIVAREDAGVVEFDKDHYIAQHLSHIIIHLQSNHTVVLQQVLVGL